MDANGAVLLELSLTEGRSVLLLQWEIMGGMEWYGVSRTEISIDDRNFVARLI